MVHIVKLECPRLTDKFCRRSIVWRYLMYEYVYELFSRNIPEYLIIPIWNFLFKDIEHIQLQTILLSVALMKHYEEKLSKCKRVR